MKAFVILNPASGKNSRDPIREAISRHFTGIDYEVYETIEGDKPGDIVRTRLKDKFDLVVAAGGDGTVSAVIDGLVDSNVPLGIIPAGTGNLIAHELNLPVAIDDAVALIAGTHKSRKIDAMRIGKRVYILNASLGISASVAGGTTSKNKNRFGRIAYLWTAIMKIFTLRSRYLTVTIDGKALKYNALEVAIFNCGILAKALYPKGPDICIDDGHIDVWIVSMQTILDYPWYLFEMITGRPAKRLSHFINSKKSVSIKSRIPLPVQADGDIIGTTSVEIEVISGAVTVIVSEKPLPVTPYNLDRNSVRSQYLSGFARTRRRK